jgi:hypothetical protein
MPPLNYFLGSGAQREDGEGEGVPERDEPELDSRSPSHSSEGQGLLVSIFGFSMFPYVVMWD